MFRKSFILVFALLLAPLGVSKAETGISSDVAKFTVVRTIPAKVTAYSSSRKQTDKTPFITASGVRVRDGIVACPITLKFGTRVRIMGKVYVCEDRTAKRFGGKDSSGHYRFDIWKSSHSAAKEHGIKRITVEVLVYAPRSN